MSRLLLIGTCVSVLAGCASDPTSGTKPNAYDLYDDISNLECRGHKLNKVSECQLQEAREKLGAENVTWECRQILSAWRDGDYDKRCGEMR